MELRAYRAEDCAQMAALFYETVHTVNAKDYTKEQLDAWATGEVDMEAWNASFLEHRTIVAVEEGRIIGFGDMDRTGYLDRLYVHAAHQGEGVATAICDRLEEGCPNADTYTTHASITARPFFERRGYLTIRRQEVERRGVVLVNFVMEKRRLSGEEKAVNLASEKLLQIEGANGASEAAARIVRVGEEEERLIRECAALLVECFDHCWDTLEEGVETVRDVLQSGTLFAAVIEGRTVGFVGIHPEYRPYGWELHPLAVAEGFRRCGIGSRLLLAAEREAAKQGVLTLYLGTDDECGATSLSEGDLFEDPLARLRNIHNYKEHPYAFYQKNGYQLVGVLPDVNGYGKPDIYMAKRVAERKMEEKKEKQKMQGQDMIVNLKDIAYTASKDENIKIKRAFAGDKEKILQFVRENFSASWAGEAECACLQSPSQCFIATKEGKILGFACYDVSAKGFFGPIGVLEEARGDGVGTCLLTRTLETMRSAGYGYAIIGWVGDAEKFYRKTVGANFIEGGTPENSVYSNMVEM